MNNSEIRYNYYSPKIKSIIGEMYGRDKGPERKFIKIDKKELILSKDGDCFLYQWGWPGPDVNFYEFKDYGITWAFYEKDLVNRNEI